MHIAVYSIAKGLFWGSIRKEGYGVLVGETGKARTENSELLVYYSWFPSVGTENNIYAYLRQPFCHESCAFYVVLADDHM